MRILKLIANAAAVLFVLPVLIVGILGILFSPLQTVARATEPRVALEAHDLMLSEAVNDEVAKRSQGQFTGKPTVHAAAAEAEGDTSESGNEFGESGGSDNEADVANPMASDESDSAKAADLEGGQLPGVDDSSLAGVSYEESVALDESQGQVGGSWYSQENPSGFGEYPQYGPESNGAYYSSEQLLTQGVIDDGTYRYTWYSQRVLPGGGLNIEGRHVTEEGYVADSQERIVLASSDLPYGTEVAIPFGSGTGVVLDTGCASGTLDVYTNF